MAAHEPVRGRVARVDALLVPVGEPFKSAGDRVGHTTCRLDVQHNVDVVGQALQAQPPGADATSMLGR